MLWKCLIKAKGHFFPRMKVAVKPLWVWARIFGGGGGWSVGVPLEGGNRKPHFLFCPGGVAWGTPNPRGPHSPFLPQLGLSFSTSPKGFGWNFLELHLGTRFLFFPCSSYLQQGRSRGRWSRAICSLSQ